MSKWLQLVLILTIIGLSKAQLKLIVLGVLGLAGLWMVHTLAQDYQKISGSSNNDGYFSSISKRSIDNRRTSKLKYPNIDWDRVMNNDPSSCARSFTCQLAAVPEEELQENEKVILNTISSENKLINVKELKSKIDHFHRKQSTKSESWSEIQIRKALNYGESSEKDDKTRCQKQYKQCPYSLRTMMKLLKLLGDMGDIQNNISSPMLYT